MLKSKVELTKYTLANTSAYPKQLNQRTREYYKSVFGDKDLSECIVYIGKSKKARLPCDEPIQNLEFYLDIELDKLLKRYSYGGFSSSEPTTTYPKPAEYCTLTPPLNPPCMRYASRGLKQDWVDDLSASYWISSQKALDCYNELAKDNFSELKRIKDATSPQTVYVGDLLLSKLGLTLRDNSRLIVKGRFFKFM